MVMQILWNAHVHTCRDAKVRASTWSREQEAELATLYDQYQDEDGMHLFQPVLCVYVICY